MIDKKWRARTKHDLTIEVWEDLDCESVGARELEQIQQTIRLRFGEGAVESPAAIARTLADEGAMLRHPEVLDCDAKWRERHIFGEVPMDQFDFSSLSEAAESIRRLEYLRRKFEHESEETELRRVHEMALAFKQESQLVSRSKVVAGKKRFEAREIAQWLTVWMQEPHIFEDWLNLRQRSPEFIHRFRE
jgi:hypothetical protein